ncbi:MAG: hypothetical protein J6K15_11350, partial [Lachnospiraceae bacterium]|nr:hypothetical protein [Lachnospiraceae bacterium]
MIAVVSRLWLMSLQGCVLILIVLLARLLLKKYPKILSYSLWALVGIRLLCPVFIESSVSLQPDFSRLQNNWENPRQETTEKTLPVQIAP